MGKLIWSQWAKLIAFTAGFFETIGGIFGIFYRISMAQPITTAFSILNYQNVNPALYLLIASFMYIMAIVKGEERALRTQAKQNGMRRKMGA
ncbi:2621_t:CDS:2 [Diversispora eburnea]|uniref:2621_t:CDS:1 n=1 Tax=Diversispora eburnea TaxID=1213867 RepID=A0A9N9FP66_9GLOM|nr:2621_t:CDS:2 [Diversispora eburnea]